MFKFGAHEKILVLFVTLALLLNLFLITQDITVLIGKFLADDAYYAYSLAKNIINGHGIVFNEGVPTNGFHPLYNLVILVPLFKLLYGFGPNLPIYASLFVLSLFSVGTSVFIYAIVSKLLNKRAGIFAAFVWLFNPHVIFVSLMGLEVAIQIFFISLLSYLMLKLKGKHRFSTADLFFIGTLIGVIFLSRMDGIFIGIGIVATIILRKMFLSRKIDFTLIKNIVIITFVATLVVSPWLIWSFVKLGVITPISGESVRILNSLKLGSGYNELVAHSVSSFAGFVSKFFLYTTDTVLLGAVTIFVALAVPFIILLIKRDNLLSRIFFSLDFLVVGSILYYMFYFFYQLNVAGWYAMYTNFITTILFSLFLIRTISMFRYEKLLTFIVITLLAASFVYGGALHYKRGNYPFQILNFEAVKYINENIPVNDKIGSFNTGILQYYSENHDIINLDGVMNPESLQAFKNASIDKYILDKNITYIMDDPGYVNTFRKINRPLLQLEEIKLFKLSWYSYKNGEGISTLKLFRVTPLETSLLQQKT